MKKWIGAIALMLFALPAMASTASFVKVDSATQGSWIGAYGADGYFVSQDSKIKTPSYASVKFNWQSNYTWSASNPDVRALQKPESYSDRIAGTWYSTVNFTIDINLTDGNTHRVALYALDWDSTLRRETINVLNASTGAVLDSRTLATSFHNGTYLVWNVQGHVKFQIALVSGVNAVISGLFLDPPGATTTTTTTPTTTTPTTTTPSSYTTNFPLTEKPISESGHWTSQTKRGITYGMATTPGFAYGLQPDGADGVDDGTAILTGSWHNDQFAQGTVKVKSLADYNGSSPELELHLHMKAASPAGWTGYEITHSVCGGTNGSYLLIVHWNGNDTYDTMNYIGGPQYCVNNGDTVRAEVRANNFTISKNGRVEYTFSDSKYQTGAPGIGSCCHNPTPATLGFSSFTGGNLQ